MPVPKLSKVPLEETDAWNENSFVVWFTLGISVQV